LSRPASGKLQGGEQHTKADDQHGQKEYFSAPQALKASGKHITMNHFGQVTVRRTGAAPAQSATPQ
jgi:hypothetical protein